MKRVTLELNKIWSRALRAALMILPLGLSGCFDNHLPPAGNFDLAVSVSGSGSINSSPAGIACGSDCAETLAAGSSITLNATPASGAMFTGWGGDCSGSTPSCTLTMNANRAVTASFTFTTDPPPPAGQYSLSVSVTGIGSVTSTPAGISCGTDCTEHYADGTSVTLTATAGTGFQFSSWGGACSGSGACMVAMSANRIVTATFTNSTTQILFEERFDNPGSNLTFGFDGWLFGYSNQPWTREHLTTGGINNGPAFRATSTFDSYIIGDDVSIGNGGTSYYFLKNLSGNLAEHSRDFWVRQCMKHLTGYLDARTRGPIGAKINYFIGSGGGFLDYTPISGTFQAQERVVGQSSGARADTFLPYENTNVRITNIVGTFQADESIVGQTSGATATLVSFSAEERTIGFNHFWHPGGTEEWRGDGYQELTWYDNTSDHYFGSNNAVNQVRHNNWLLLQDHYNEWMCLETHFDLDQVPWLVEIYVTTAPGAATLASGTTALDTNGRRQFNDYLYIRYSNPTSPALEPGFGIDFNQYGAFGLTLTNDEIYFDEYLISTGKVGHPFR